MRVDRLDLIAYGPFTGVSLDLAEGNAGLHLIYGDNEAGKSTALRALIAWLFGIPARTADNFLHSNPKLRIGGKLRLSNGEELEFLRRKGNKGTLLSPESDSPLDDSLLLPFIPSSIDENLFRRLYGIDHARLVEGGEELLNQSGDIGQALFSAAVGTADLRNMLDELKSEAEELFNPRAYTRTVNKAIADYREAVKQIKDSSLPVSKWKQWKKELSDALSEIGKVEGIIEEKSKEQSRLARLKRVSGPLAERRSVLADIEELGDVLPLPEDFGETYRNALEKLRNSSEDRKKAETRLQRLKEESKALSIRDELLDSDEEILSIYRELGAVQKAIQDRPGVDADRRRLRDEAQTQLKGVRPDIDPEDTDKLRPVLNNGKMISSLARQHDKMNTKEETAQSDLREIKDSQLSTKKKLRGMPVQGLNLAEVKATIAQARKAGDIEKRLSDSKEQASEAMKSCKSELKRLGRYSGTVEELLQLTVPVQETLDRFDKRFEELSEKLRDNERKRNEIEEERKQAQRDLKALLLGSDVPAISELEASRAVRNTGWKLIKSRYIDDDYDLKDIEEYAPESELPEVYEQNVKTADSISDKLRLAADHVVKRADLEAKIEDLSSRLKDKSEEIKTDSAEREAILEKWNAVWQDSRVDPGTPREMKQWLVKAEKLIENVRTMEKLFHHVQKLEVECEGLKEAVSSQIESFRGTVDLEKMSLEAMISICEQRVEEEEACLEQKRDLEKDLTGFERKLKENQDVLKSIKEERSRWRKEWGEAVMELGLEPDVHPERAIETFSSLEKFFRKLDASEDYRKRVGEIDEVIERFQERVFEFAERIGVEREDRDSCTIAAHLNRDLNDAREARASRDKLKVQIRETEEQIEEDRIEIDEAEQQLDSLRKQAEVKKNEELESAARRARKMRSLKERLDVLEQELNRSGDGLSIEDLEDEAEQSNVDSIEGELENIDSELKDYRSKRDDLRDVRNQLETRIQSNEGSAEAANASDKAEQLLAAITSGAERYIRLQMAALMLEQQIEEYRKKNQAPVLARAGDIFSRFTRRSFTNLRDELNNKGRPILLGVRESGEEVSVSGMSDGTRDQLYLALRISTLQQHLSSGEPMPFVVDDVLIGFDDDRTRVCLEVLADLAASTQVMLFTHHRRVLELADSLDAEAGVYSHELA